MEVMPVPVGRMEVELEEPSAGLPSVLLDGLEPVLRVALGEMGVGNG